MSTSQRPNPTISPSSPESRPTSAEQRSSHGPTIDPRDYIAPGTGFQKNVGMVLAIGGMILGSLTMIISTAGIGLIFLLIGLFIYSRNLKQQRVLIDGSALRIGDDQFPAIHQLVQQTAAKMNMAEVPDTYIYETSDQNAGALKVKGKPVILLTDDLVWGAASTKENRVLQFIIAHELAHHALGHTGLIRSWVSTTNKKLSRLDEFSCDAVATAVIDDAEIAARALVLLAVGPQLLPKVNLQRLMAQATEVAKHKLAAKAERPLTHPMLLRRIARVMGTQMKLK